MGPGAANAPFRLAAAAQPALHSLLGLHWPKLDADLFLPALLQGVYGSPRWMAGLLG